VEEAETETERGENALPAAVSAFREPFLDNFGENKGDLTLNTALNSIKWSVGEIFRRRRGRNAPSAYFIDFGACSKRVLI
jgi:hypothetical protein